MAPKSPSARGRKRRHVETVFVESSDSEVDAQIARPPPQIVRRRSRVASEALGITPVEYRRLKRFGVPQLFLQVLSCLFVLDGHCELLFDGAEWMAGKGHIEHALNLDGLTAFSFEIERDRIYEDFCGIAGFIFGTQRSRQLKWRAINHWDTVCSSWVWMSRRTSMRSYLDPLGNLRNEKVLLGNRMVARMIILSLFHLARMCVWLLEQPTSSLMRFHSYMPRLEFACAYMKRQNGEQGGIDDIPTWMASFGGNTPKRSTLSGSHRAVLFPLYRTLSASERKALNAVSVVDERFAIENGQLKHKVTGRRKQLKQTQEYPPAYGVAVSTAYKKWLLSQPALSSPESSDSDYEDVSPNWQLAELGPVAAALCAKVSAVRCMR